MTAKEYLRQLYIMRRQLRSIRMKLEELQLEAVGIGAIRYDKERVQTSPEDYLPGSVSDLLDVEKKYQRMIVRYHTAVQQRIRMIEKLDNPTYIRILTLRYCDGLSFDKIAVEMNYTYRHVLRLHGNALSAFGRRYQDRLYKQ